MDMIHEEDEYDFVCSDFPRIADLNTFPHTRISLDGTLCSDLAWSHLKEKARAAQEKILWAIDLGLFGQLSYPLNHEMQCRTLGLGLEHFCQTLWKEFREKSTGVCLYCGSLDFSVGFPWDEETIHRFRSWVAEGSGTLFEESEIKIHDITPDNCIHHPQGIRLLRLFTRDLCMAFFHILIGYLHPSVPPFLMCDAREVTNPLQCAELLHSESYKDLHLLVQNIPYPIYSQANIGICLPNDCRRIYGKSEECFQFLIHNHLPFRVIGESHLMMDWEGIDDLIVFSDNGQVRKLQGFCAAGGRVVNAGEGCLGLPEEISWIEWLHTHPHSKSCEKSGFYA